MKSEAGYTSDDELFLISSKSLLLTWYKITTQLK